MKTEVHFRSTAFNCTEPRDYFINDGCFGDDVARWLIRQLEGRGLKVASEPGQEDFGWYFTFHAGGAEHCFIIGFQPNDPAAGHRWHGWLERRVGFVASVFGGHKRGVRPVAVEAIDAALRASSDIQFVTWRERGGDEAAGC